MENTPVDQETPDQLSLFPPDEPPTSVPAGAPADGCAGIDISRTLPNEAAVPLGEGAGATATPSPHGTVQMLPLASLDPSPQAWHLRRDLATSGIGEMLDAVRVTGVIEPIRVVPRGDRYLIVSGVRRYHAAIRRRSEGGPNCIHAVVVDDSDPAALIRWTLLNELAKEDPSYLEVGWGLVRLRQTMEAEGATAVSQVELMRYLGLLSKKKWKSRVCEYLKTAAAMPEPAAEAAAAAYGCRLGELADQPRAILRHIRKADSRAHAILLDILAESVAQGTPAGPPVRAARTSLEQEDVLTRVAAAVAAGKPASSVLTPPAVPAAKVQVPRPSMRARVRIAAERCRSWLCGLLDAMLARARAVVGTVNRTAL